MNKRQIKDGDKVRLKKNLKVGNGYGPQGVYEFRDTMVFEGTKTARYPDGVSFLVGNYYYPCEMLIKVKLKNKLNKLVL